MHFYVKLLGIKFERNAYVDNTRSSIGTVDTKSTYANRSTVMTVGFLPGVVERVCKVPEVGTVEKELGYGARIKGTVFRLCCTYLS